MPTLNIEGHQVNVDDSFLKLSPEDQNATVDEIHKSLGGPAPAADIGENRASTIAGLRGIPIGGAYVDKAAAALNAAAQPFTETGLSHAGTFGERMAENEPKIKSAVDAYEQANPIGTTVGKLALGTAALAPVGATAMGARALGMAGPTLTGMVARGALSGGALGGADAAARGEDIAKGVEGGALFGGGGPMIGRVAGKVASAVMGKLRPEPVVPQRTAQVGGAEIPLTEAEVTRDPNVGSEEQIIQRGGRGVPAQETAQDFLDRRDAALTQVHGDISSGLDPTGQNPRTAPEDAGQAVSRELASQEAQRAAAEAQRVQGAANDRNQLIGSMDQPGTTTPAVTPHGMGEAISDRLRTGAQQAAEARTAAYDRTSQIPGEFTPSVFTRAGNAIRDRLNQGANPVRVTDRLTPNTADALGVIDEDLGHLRFEDQTRRGEMIIGPDGRPQDRPITGSDVEATRKKLIQLQRAANNSARAPGGSYEDARGMRRLITEFDNHVERGINAGGFSGDGQAYLDSLRNARALHAQYRQNYSSQGAGDKVGQAIEGIIGKRPGQEASPDAIIKTILGSANEPGGGQTVQIVQRLRGLLGEGSPEWAAIRKGMISHLTESPAGLEAVPHGEQANRILNFLNGNKGRTLAQVLYNPSERAALAAHANGLRSVSDPMPTTLIDKTISRLSGRNGNLPATSHDIVNSVMGSDGSGGDVDVIRALKQRLSPEGWNSLRQGVWQKLTTRGEDMTPFEAQALHTRLSRFLNDKGKEASVALFTPQERTLMGQLAGVYKQMIPVKGTTNPSGTAPMLAKIANGTKHQLLPLLGFSHGGMMGAAVGAAADRGLTAIGNARAATKAQNMFFGQQPKRPVNPSIAPATALLTQGSLPARQQRSR